MDFGEVASGEVASGAVAGIELGSPPNKSSQAELEDDAEAARAAARTSEKARERQLVGSLTTTYRFKGPCPASSIVVACLGRLTAPRTDRLTICDCLRHCSSVCFFGSSREGFGQEGQSP